MLGVVVPCYNEEAVIKDLIDEFTGLRKTLDLDLILVDDGSTDETREILKGLSKGRGWIKIISHHHNMGLAQSLKDGFSFALKQGYRFIAQMDADLTHPPHLLKDMMSSFNGSDMVIASRYKAGGGMKDVPGWRVIVSRIGNRFFRILLGIKTKDSTSGFRVVKREVYEKIVLNEDSFGIQLEITVKAERCGFKIKEVPFTLSTRKKGSSKFRLRYLLGYIPLTGRMMVKRGC